MRRLRRRELLAYLVGAGVAGTILVIPFVLRDAALRFFLPGRTVPIVPFFLLPLFWGFWNLLWVRWQPHVDVGTWGAMLGFALSVSVNLYLRWQDAWFQAALLFVVFLPIVYYLVWHLVLGPLNEALGVEGDRPRASVAAPRAV
jgi:hypothetical protein